MTDFRDIRIPAKFENWREVWQWIESNLLDGFFDNLRSARELERETDEHLGKMS